MYNHNIFLFTKYFLIGVTKNVHIKQHVKIKFFNLWNVFDFKNGVLASSFRRVKGDMIKMQPLNFVNAASLSD